MGAGDVGKRRGGRKDKEEQEREEEGEVEKEAETEKEEGGVGQGRRSCRATHGEIIIVIGVINIIAINTHVPTNSGPCAR